MYVYNFHINAHDLVLLGTLFITGTFILLLWFGISINRAANRFLALALVVIMLHMFWVLGPLIYLYSLKITRPEYKFRWKDLLLLCPLLLWTFSLIVYLYLSRRLIEQFYQQQKFSGGDRDRHELRWLDQQLFGFGILWLFWIFGMDLMLGMMTVCVAAAAFLRREADPSIRELSAELREKGSWLKKTVKANLYYQDADLTLGSLAEKLGMHPYELSRIINNVLKKSFHDFINEYRVAEVKRKMRDPANDHLTLMGIAYDCGFNSKSTFHRIFKEMTGKSPAEYKIYREKELPTYKWGPYTDSAGVLLYLNRIYMLKNYFKTAWRNLKKNKIFTGLNITGLSVGLTCSLLIALYVQDELNYDRFNTHANHIFRIDEQVKFGDFSYNGTETPAVMGPAFIKDFKEIEHYTRFKNSPGIVIRKGNENLREDKVLYAESSLFNVFTLDMIAGDKRTALKEPHSLVITESIARKYFGSTDVIGKTVLVDGTTNYKITGVIKNIPTQSHFACDLFMPICELESSQYPSWINFNYQTYLLLKPGTDILAFEKKMNRAMAQYQSPQFKTELNTSQADFEKAGNYIKCSLMPLLDIHLYSHVADELGINGSIQDVYIFSAIAIFILLIACINFMNLSTASSANRAKEVGVRKVLGGLKNNLITQFLTESFLACLLSFVVAITAAALLLPFFNQLAGKQINGLVLLSAPIVSGILLLIILVSLISGSYPAFFLSSFQPIKVLKGSLSAGFKGSILRNTLVVFQFTISVVLMIGTLVIYNQLRYIRNKDLGFNKEQVLLLQNTAALNNNTKAFTNELLQMTGVKNVTSSGFLPVTGARNSNGFVRSAPFDGKNFTLMQTWAVDERYLPTFQIRLKSGRNFSPQYPTDSTAIIINETAAKLFGGADPVNKKLYQIGDLSTGQLTAFHIIGVVKDFNFNSLREQVGPMILKLQENNGGMAVRISSRDISGLLDEIKSKWNAMVSSEPLSYTFLDEVFSKQYSADQQMGKIFLLFSILAILIACLGLFGLVTFAAEQRLKEIGIRKVLGAGISDIFRMLSTDFIKLLVLSICIASPIAWWAMNKWLQDFAYRISIGWWMFVTVGVICLLIAIVTISFQAIKAAVANPVTSLRSE